MHKHLSARVVAAAVIFIIASLGVVSAGADSASLWISSPLTIKRQADSASIPVTISGTGNVDCAQEDSLSCSVPTNYGSATSNSTVRLNSYGKFLPVTTYIDNRPHFYPVPNSDVALSLYSGQVYGFNMAFNRSFTASAVKSVDSFAIARPPDAYLTDKSKHHLPADGLSMSFSENGRWMIVSSPNLAMLRVNLDTFEVLPFALGFNYTIGLDPSVRTAVSNDGRYAVVASKNFLTFKLYDLSTCAAVPDTISGAVACQSRDLRGPMQAQVPGYNMTASARFMNDDLLAAYISYTSGTSTKLGRFTIGTGSGPGQIQYLAVGDSYISGEGAFDYQGGTDTPTNKCHLSYLAYPYLIGQDLNYDSYHSVACSGATTKDITNAQEDYSGQDSRKIKRSDRSQADIDSLIAAFTPGDIDQLDFVKTYQPQVINLSVGGNDMGFSNILKKCVDPRNLQTCYSTYEDRLELVRQINTVVLPRLIQTYQKIKAAGPPDMRIYVIGYPQIAKPGGDCGINVHLNSDEVLFSQELINYLDQIVQTAAARTGVYYVDTQDALDGHRLCEAKPGTIAVNGLTAGNDRPTLLHGPIGDESYHPNAAGYKLLEKKILSATHDLTDPMPSASGTATAPSESGLAILDAPKNGRTINTAEFDNNIAADLTYRGSTVDISINGSLHGLPPATNLAAELHSEPISLGSFASDSYGSLDTKVAIPASVPTGYHTLHFYGTDLTGQAIDIYKQIYIAATPDDIDGDGIPDSTKQCAGLSLSGQDFDIDGVDDACDGNITQPPAPAETGNPGPAESTEKEIANGSNNQANIQSPDSNVLTTEATASLVPGGIDSGEILINAAKPPAAVLSAVTSKSETADSKNSLNDNPSGKYILPGALTMVIGILGLIFKSRLF